MRGVTPGEGLPLFFKSNVGWISSRKKIKKIDQTFLVEVSDALVLPLASTVTHGSSRETRGSLVERRRVRERERERERGKERDPNSLDKTRNPVLQLAGI